MYVYCAENRSMPGLVKIGMTEDHPLTRMVQLSSLTSVPTEFICAWSAFTLNPAKDERRLHQALKEHRVANNREFFRCSPGYARSAAESIGLLVIGAEVPSTRDHTVGYPNAEWIGALGFFALFVITFPIWYTDLTWYYKPVINVVLPFILGAIAQAYLSVR